MTLSVEISLSRRLEERIGRHSRKLAFAQLVKIHAKKLYYYNIQMRHFFAEFQT